MTTTLGTTLTAHASAAAFASSLSDWSNDARVVPTIELDVRADSVLEATDLSRTDEGDNARSFDEYHGLVRVYKLRGATTDEVAALLDEVAPLLERIVAGSDEQWDGRNTVGVLNADAADASDDLERACELFRDGGALTYATDEEVRDWVRTSSEPLEAWNEFSKVSPRAAFDDRSTLERVSLEWADLVLEATGTPGVYVAGEGEWASIFTLSAIEAEVLDLAGQAVDALEEAAGEALEERDDEREAAALADAEWDAAERFVRDGHTLATAWGMALALEENPAAPAPEAAAPAAADPEEEVDCEGCGEAHPVSELDDDCECTACAQHALEESARSVGFGHLLARR